MKLILVPFVRSWKSPHFETLTPPKISNMSS